MRRVPRCVPSRARAAGAPTKREKRHTREREREIEERGRGKSVALTESALGLEALVLCGCGQALHEQEGLHPGLLKKGGGTSTLLLKLYSILSADIFIRNNVQWTRREREGPACD